MASEKELAFNWDMGDGVSFNFKCFIDRIDFVEGKLRIVDYKTGSDDVQISKPDDFEDLFAPDSNGAHKKLFCNCCYTATHMQLMSIMQMTLHLLYISSEMWINV